MRRYHVFIGIPGCLPAYSQACETLADAYSVARMFKDDAVANGETVTGDIRRHGSYQFEAGDYLWIVWCEDNDCELCAELF